MKLMELPKPCRANSRNTNSVRMRTRNHRKSAGENKPSALLVVLRVFRRFHSFPP